jgi:large subunit ribosomal protein L19e
MKLTTQKNLAAKVLKCSGKKVWLDSTKIASIKEAITKIDVKNLIKEGLIAKKKVAAQSKGRVKKLHTQKVKGRKSGKGSKKGTPNARLSDKDKWMLKIRSLRKLLRELKEKELVSVKDYRDLYAKAKGGFFRNKRHIKLYIKEHNMLIKNEKAQ